jgi:hypothetical protein
MCIARGSRPSLREDGRKRGCIYTLAGLFVGRKRGSNWSSVQLCLVPMMRVSRLCYPGRRLLLHSAVSCSPPGRRVPFEFYMSEVMLAENVRRVGAWEPMGSSEQEISALK